MEEASLVSRGVVEVSRASREEGMAWEEEVVWVSSWPFVSSFSSFGVSCRGRELFTMSD